MSTNFYLADARYMNKAEIADAEAFDESALICQKSAGETGAVFTLEIDTIPFYALPIDARVVNNNNDLKINTVGDLIDATREASSQVITRHEAEQTANASLAKIREYRKSSPD